MDVATKDAFYLRVAPHDLSKDFAAVES